MKTRKKYQLLKGTKEEKEEYERISNNLNQCKKKCSKERKRANQLDAKNAKIVMKMKCNMDPELNHKFDAYNKAVWPLGEKYPTSPCIKEKQKLINDPTAIFTECMRQKCKKERDEFYKPNSKEGCIIC